MNPVSKISIKGKPWGWIPSVYIAEGLPYFAVNVLTVLMYTKMGVSLEKMAFYTGTLYLPWVIKPFWSPFIDIFKTKRWWTLTMQLLICITMAWVMLLIHANSFFPATLIVFWFMAFFSATHDIAADGFYMMALNDKEQAAFVGVRSTFYRIASVLGQGGVVILAGLLETRYDDVPMSWSVTFGILSLFSLLVFLWDNLIMPRPERDRPLPGVTARKILADFLNTFTTFFSKKQIWVGLLFMLLYRLPEALCLKIVIPFLIATPESGGLGMSTSEVGFANGTVGVIALLAGGIIGGLIIARKGLGKCLWPMALALTLPCVVYCIFAVCHPHFTLICVGIGIEQFGYGFGFTAYMLYLMYFSKGESQTSHYAFCTAFMALGMMIPGMVAGWIFEWLKSVNEYLLLPGGDYFVFFCFVVATSIFTFLAVYVVKPGLNEYSGV